MNRSEMDCAFTSTSARRMIFGYQPDSCFRRRQQMAALNTQLDMSLMEIDETSCDSGIGLEPAPCSTPCDDDVMTDVSAPADQPTTSSGSVDAFNFSFDGSSGNSASASSSDQPTPFHLPHNLRQLLQSPILQEQPSSVEAFRRVPAAASGSGRRRVMRNLTFDSPAGRSPLVGRMADVEDSPCGAAVASPTVDDSGRRKPLRRRRVRLVDTPKRSHDADGVTVATKRAVVDDEMQPPSRRRPHALDDVSDDVVDLVGDMSRAHVLPTVNNSKHADLKTITSDTLASVLASNYAESVERFIIIDCRYPYEFEGGHIQTARNLCTKDEVMAEFLTSAALRQPSTTGNRTILIFHCEFSSERGPKMLRFLRNEDRAAHGASYPALHYPELYLLQGGYKAFYEAHADLCEPHGYRPMLHVDHTEDLRRFRVKSKSWAGDRKQRTVVRPVQATPAAAAAAAATASCDTPASVARRRHSLLI